jgi:hypothetical protein
MSDERWSRSLLATSPEGGAVPVTVIAGSSVSAPFPDTTTTANKATRGQALKVRKIASIWSIGFFRLSMVVGGSLKKFGMFIGNDKG